MPPGLDALKHIVVLMMENRSFDHMRGSLKAVSPQIDGLAGTESNPDINGNLVQVQPLAESQSQLEPDPDHHFPAVDQLIFNGDQNNPRVPSMQGFRPQLLPATAGCRPLTEDLLLSAGKVAGSEINGNPWLSSYNDCRFRAPNFILFREGFEHSIWGPIGFVVSADEGKVALTRGNIGFDQMAHGFSAGVTLRAGGLPAISFAFAWGGTEGTHTIATVNTSLLGGSTRPSQF